MVAFAANSPCLAGVCRSEGRLPGPTCCTAVPEPRRKLLASPAGQRVRDVSLPCVVGWEAVAAEERAALFRGWGRWGVVAELGWAQALPVSPRGGAAGLGRAAARARAVVVEDVHEVPLGLRITKPLTFADCVGDELPLGWETVYDQQIGVYYMDHINQLTQIEDPREQWRREQERMLKEYLIVAQEALNAKKEIYQIKQQRFELAQEEYQQLHKMCEDDSRSYASSFSGFSTNTKYDPYQIKAEIASRRDRLSRLKRELAQMKQELQYKEKGVETLQEIDRKMSSAHTNYRLDEAQAIMSELRTIKKAICTGEKERQDLMQ
ncbi:PREDICTED: protein WWC3-like, partial [Cariama cristata]|uniref:protein WWC3-like n=1 Tax=Cariama cristata TaxID=54380 RepID=UPI000520E68D